MGTVANNDPETLSVAIIGGGITGVNLALGLQHRLNSNPSLENKLSYTIYERASGFREIGAGIGFSPNAERAMGILSPDVLSSFKRVANPNGEDYFQWINGTTDGLLFKLYCGKDGFQGCRRSDILEEWAKLIPAERVQFSKTVDTVSEETSDGKVTITFTDGSKVYADVVIGCDGIRSRIRQLIVPQHSESAVPHYSQKFCFRSLVPMPVAVAAIGHQRAYTRYMYNGPDAHIITYPVGNNSVLNVLAVISDPNPWPDKLKHTAVGSKSEAVEAFKDWHETPRKIVDLFPEDDGGSAGGLGKWAVFDMAEFPCDRYVSERGRVGIAGDAAHAMGPHLGAGGGMGIEDALVLSSLLADVAIRAASRTGKDELIKAALKAYNDVRYERTQWVVQKTRDTVDLFQWRDKNVAADGEKFGSEVTKTFHQVWEYDVEGMVKEALAKVENDSMRGE
ncbi:salicylate hydroxylase [Naviculisporaceae sp. PSN 640]